MRQWKRPERVLVVLLSLLTLPSCGLAWSPGPSSQGSAAAGEAAPDHIPVLASTTLSGEKVQLPRDLATGGRSAVLVIGFGRGASEAAREWGGHLAQATAHTPQTTYYVVPVVSGVPSLLRGSVLRAIGHSVSANGKRHFLPIVSDEPAWRRVTGVQDESVPYLLLVNSAGEVRWRGAGAFSDATYKALQQQIAALQTATPPTP